MPFMADLYVILLIQPQMEFTHLFHRKYLFAYFYYKEMLQPDVPNTSEYLYPVVFYINPQFIFIIIMPISIMENKLIKATQNSY